MPLQPGIYAVAFTPTGHIVPGTLLATGTEIDEPIIARPDGGPGNRQVCPLLIEFSIPQTLIPSISYSGK